MAEKKTYVVIVPRSECSRRAEPRFEFKAGEIPQVHFDIDFPMAYVRAANVPEAAVVTAAKWNANGDLQLTFADQP